MSNQVDETVESNGSEMASTIEATAAETSSAASVSVLTTPNERERAGADEDRGESTLSSTEFSSQQFQADGAVSVSTGITNDIGQGATAMDDATTDSSFARAYSVNAERSVTSSSLRHSRGLKSNNVPFVKLKFQDNPSSSFSKSGSLQNSQMLSELTINKLNIKDMELFGREKEMSLLKEWLALLSYRATTKDENNKNEKNDATGSNLDHNSATDENDNDVPHQPSPLLVSSQAPIQLIFIKGYSGVGKSSLASALERHIMNDATTQHENTRRAALFVRGKFDLTSSDGPYSGVSQVFGQIVQKVGEIMALHDGCAPNLADFRQSIQKLLGEKELELLTQLVPELRKMIKKCSSNSSSSSSKDLQPNAVVDAVAADADTTTAPNENLNLVDPYTIENGQERMKYTFQILTRELTSFFSPAILLFDDLQFADVASLEVIDNILSDQQNPNPLMIIGCYRSNEVDKNSILYNRIQSLNEKQEIAGFDMTEIEVKACELEDVNKMILSMLGIDDPGRTSGLAKITFKRTLGNPFFVIQFVKMLVDEGLITFNLGLLKWTWDDDKIDAATMSTDNVVELLKMKLRKLPPKVQLFLQHAACLGSVFRLSTLDLVWRKCNAIHLAANQQVDDEYDNVQGMIDLAVEESILEKHDASQQKYRWVHDQIQGAAMTLSTTFDESFEFGIGTAMLYTMEENDLEEHLFEVADLINKGKASESLDFAQLNLRAAEKARRLSAFQSASKFAANGIRRLPNDKWQSNRSLTPTPIYIGS